MNKSYAPEEFPRWLWLVLPVLVLPVQFLIEFLFTGDVYAALMSEYGPHEQFQFLILLGAFVAALRGLIMAMRTPETFLKIWFLIAAVACFYVGGEEISWGQHLFDWATPEFWSQINDQNETNLHNTSSWLDQKPRLALEIGVVVGGLILPTLMKFKPATVPAWLARITPPPVLAVTAGLYLAVKLADAVGDWTKIEIFGRASEVTELYMFYFVLLYLIGLRRRLMIHGLGASRGAAVAGDGGTVP